MSREIPPQGEMMKTPAHGRIYIVGEAPGATEDMVGMAFVGASGRLLFSNMLGKARIYRNEVRVANVYWRRPPGNDFAKTDPALRERYEEALHEDIARSRPDLIVAVGEQALRVLTGLSGITQHRGFVARYLYDSSIVVLPMIHPAATLRNWDYYAPSLRDAQKAARLSLHGPPKREERFLLDVPVSEFVERLDALPDGSVVALDIETIPAAHVVMLIGVAWSHEEAMVLNLLHWNASAIADALEALERTASRCQFVGHNINYDQSWLWMMLATWVPFRWCTQAMHHTLCPEGEKSLRYCCSIWLDVEAWKSEASIDLMHYCAMDCTNTWWLHQRLLRELEHENLMEFYMEHAHARKEPATFMSCRGIRVDPWAQDRMLSEVEQELRQLEAVTNRYGINPSSPKQLANLLYAHFKLPLQQSRKTRRVSVDKTAIKKLAKKAEGEALQFLEAFIRWKELRSSVSKDLAVKADPLTGCLHSGYNTEGTETGRMSSSANAWGSGTNLQNRQKRYRTMFVPHREGHVFVCCDAVQAEAYVVAWLSDDAELIRVFLEGRDLHTYTASMMFGVAESAVTKEQRSIGKRVRHGCNYSMSKVTLAEILDVPQHEAAKLIDLYHRANPQLRSCYFPWVETKLRTTRKLVTPLGRRRIFHGRLSDNKTLREAFAFVPQSVVGDLAIKALSDFYVIYRDDPEVAIVAQIHDENIVEVPLERAREVALVMKRLMERPMIVESCRGSKRELVIPCSFKIGYDLGAGLRDWDLAQEPQDVLGTQVRA